MWDEIFKGLKKWWFSTHAVATYRVIILCLAIIACSLGLVAWHSGPAWVDNRIASNPTIKAQGETIVEQGKAMVAALAEQTKTLADHDKRIALQEAANSQSQELNKAIFGVVTDLRKTQQATLQDTAAIKATTQEHGMQLERIERRLDTAK